MSPASLPALSPRATPFMGDSPRDDLRRSATPRLPPASARGNRTMTADPGNCVHYPNPQSSAICANRPHDLRFGFYVIHPDWGSEQNSARFVELGRQRQMKHLLDQRPYHFYHPVNADVERLLALRRKREIERDGAYLAAHNRYAGLTPAERGEPATWYPFTGYTNLPAENVFYRRLALSPHKVNPRYVPFTY
ncbi:hypothetical protein NP493_810g01036 [Ridgeia piscesae]|uniref:Uncharacterized protein n=1 Tax=Ridgeia piscesae TaxID=27915 RepID=A0AAD9KN01_RIDPI|nr:hypothetical protein NP493_810g01036 [Ridgeia piscesae]